MQNPLNRHSHVQILRPFQLLGRLIGGDHNAALRATTIATYRHS